MPSIYPDLISHNISPLPILHPFIWFAKYKDGSEIHEIENDQTEQAFTSIKKDELSEFGILGNSGRIYFEISNGVIHLDGNRDLNVSGILDDGTRIDFTNNPNISYSDIIQYKKGNYDFTISEDSNVAVMHKSTIAANYIGYKTHMSIDGVLACNYQLIYCLPATGTNSIIFKITPDRDIKIDLHLTYLANDDHAPILLTKDHSSSFQISF